MSRYAASVSSRLCVSSLASLEHGVEVGQVGAHRQVVPAGLERAAVAALDEDLPGPRGTRLEMAR